MAGHIFVPPSCAPRLNEYCNTNCPLVHTHGPMIAAFDHSMKPDGSRWRCYAASALRVRNGNHEFAGASTAYCTRHPQLSQLFQACSSEVSAPTAVPAALSRAEVSVQGHVSPARESVVLEPWTAGPEEVVTVAAVDLRSWEPSPTTETHRVRAWSVPCIDSLANHHMRNRTRNVSARKAFLSREGLQCHGRCVRGVVDGFATSAEIAELLQLKPEPPPDRPSDIRQWRWEAPVDPPVFRTLVSRAQTILSERFGIPNLRFYRSNMSAPAQIQTKSCARQRPPPADSHQPPATSRGCCQLLPAAAAAARCHGCGVSAAAAPGDTSRARC
jgi:hypothetical protein